MLNKNVLSICLDDWSLTIGILAKKYNKINIINKYSMDIPPNIVEDGNLKNIEALKELIYKCINDYKIKEKLLNLQSEPNKKMSFSHRL